MNLDNFKLMATYNQWANQKIFEVVLEHYSKIHSYCPKILDLSLHLLMGDRLWLYRFKEEHSALSSLQKEPQLSLDHIVLLMPFKDYKNTFEEFLTDRGSLDQTIIDAMEELPSELLCTTIRYSRQDGSLYTERFDYLLQHLFNHQAHHRGQMIMLLNEMGLDCGFTDLLGVIREECQ